MKKRIQNSSRSQRPRSGDQRGRSHSNANPKQMVEKYQTMAREALSSGDRVEAERYHQHADHYYRLVTALQPVKPVVAPRPVIKEAVVAPKPVIKETVVAPKPATKEDVPTPAQ